MKSRLIVIGPLPPPVHGVTVSTGLVLANPLLTERFGVEHLDTSDHRTSDNLDKWDLTNVILGVRGAARLLRRLRGARGVVYLPLSQGTPGLLRDSLFVRCAGLAGWQVVAHLRGGEFDRVYADQNPLVRWWIRGALERLDSVAVMGESLRRLFDGLVAPERIAVVPNGTPDPHLDGRTRDPESILFLSNLRRRKGVVEAMEAAVLVVREHSSASFLFVGAWEDPELEQAMRARAVEGNGRIEFRPVLTGQDHADVLASSAMMLFPPVEPEGHPRVVLEGLAAGLPVITTDQGAIRETVVDGQSGFVLEQPVPSEIAERVLRLLRDPTLRERMGRAARARYEECFTQEIADRRLAEWLEGTARQRDRGPA